MRLSFISFLLACSFILLCSGCVGLPSGAINSEAVTTQEFSSAPNSSYFEGYWESNALTIPTSSTLREDALYASYSMHHTSAVTFQQKLDASQCGQLSQYQLSDLASDVTLTLYGFFNHDSYFLYAFVRYTTYDEGKPISCAIKIGQGAYETLKGSDFVYLSDLGYSFTALINSNPNSGFTLEFNRY